MSWPTFLRGLVHYPLVPVAALLRLIGYCLYLLGRPFVYATNWLTSILLIPWYIFAKFEALWYFLAVAIFVGTLSGIIVYGVLKTCVVLFELDRKPPLKAVPATGHDAASYRAAREAKKRKDDDKKERLAVRARLLASQPLIQEVVREARRRPIMGPTTSPISPNTGTSVTRSGLFQQTILEHSDEEEDSVF